MTPMGTRARRTRRSARRWPATRRSVPAAAAIAMALLGLAAGCQSARQVDATPPTVSYSYAEGGESETWEHAQDHCANYGLEPVVISRDPEQRYVAYACE